MNLFSLLLSLLLLLRAGSGNVHLRAIKQKWNSPHAWSHQQREHIRGSWVWCTNCSSRKTQISFPTHTARKLPSRPREPPKHWNHTNTSPFRQSEALKQRDITPTLHPSRPMYCYGAVDGVKRSHIFFLRRSRQTMCNVVLRKTNHHISANNFVWTYI